MLNNVYLRFNHSDFLRKLRHYLSDSCPILVDVTVWADCVLLTSPTTSTTVRVDLDGTKTEKENVYAVVQLLEQNLYPNVIKYTETDFSFTTEEIKKYTVLHYTMEEIKKLEQEKSMKKELWTITRISKTNLTLVLKNFKTGELLYYKFLKPIQYVLKDILELPIENRWNYIITKGKLNEV